MRRLATGGALDAPWGLAAVREHFGDLEHALIVGNFGDGMLNVVDIETGDSLGPLTDSTGAAIKIDGLWGLEFGRTVQTGSGNGGHHHESGVGLFFTAGPNGETSGLFGSLTATLTS